MDWTDRLSGPLRCVCRGKSVHSTTVYFTGTCQMYSGYRSPIVLNGEGKKKKELDNSTLALDHTCCCSSAPLVPPLDLVQIILDFYTLFLNVEHRQALSEATKCLTLVPCSSFHPSSPSITYCWTPSNTSRSSASRSNSHNTITINTDGTQGT